MLRKSFVIQAKPGMLEEYIRRHNPVWEELQVVLRNHGISNYSIFVRASTAELFGYFEAADEQLLTALQHNELMRKWWLYMKEVLVCESADSAMAKEEMLASIFYLK